MLLLGGGERGSGGGGSGGGCAGAMGLGRLHCTQDPVPEAVGGDIQQLNQLDAQQFSALTKVIFHFLTEPKEVERFLAQLSEFASTTQMGLSPLRNIVKSLLIVPSGALKKSLTAEQIQADFITLVTSGSSELEKVGSIFLQLKLVIKKGNQTKNLYIELTLPQFYSFLHEMERVRASMECLS
ncbi:COMM domain-containing protein 7 isoform X6 [Erinaceus europaeus]|uniref:COMM domain-containing protein 7 isoform X6 n=1 Tax=Erinaceus europaeus TaxID=9365 RepID=A0ABM3X6Y8_ERIEU|nr:COMM domain-containing protein 7 isoform X6 [Erinaceus europaeus]